MAFLTQEQAERIVTTGMVSLDCWRRPEVQNHAGGGGRRRTCGRGRPCSRCRGAARRWPTCARSLDGVGPVRAGGGRAAGGGDGRDAVAAGVRRGRGRPASGPDHAGGRTSRSRRRCRGTREPDGRRSCRTPSYARAGVAGAGPAGGDRGGGDAGLGRGGVDPAVYPSRPSGRSRWPTTAGQDDPAGGGVLLRRLRLLPDGRPQRRAVAAAVGAAAARRWGCSSTRPASPCGGGWSGSIPIKNEFESVMFSAWFGVLVGLALELGLVQAAVPRGRRPGRRADGRARPSAACSGPPPASSGGCR